MNVVIYARYSSERQSENTIEAQIRYCTEYCQKHEYKIISQYIDRATSASTHIEKRLEFQRMIKDSDKRTFEAVIVFKLDRFARNRYDSATYKNRLKKNGVQVISATENLSGDKESIILESVLEGMAEYFSKDLAEKVTSGMREAAMKCQSNGGLIPLGYRIENKKLVIDETTSFIVKEAFERYTKGETIASLCDDFNRRKLKTARKGEFNKNSFHNMFTNEKYIGVYKFQDIRIENGIPAIIDKDTFEAAQAKINNNKRVLDIGRYKAKTEYLLSCKIVCGKCNSNMCGESGQGKSGKIFHYYKCSNRKKNHGCDADVIPQEVIEKEVIDTTLKTLTPDVIEQIADLAMKAVNEDNDKNVIIPAIKKELKETENKINNLLITLESYQSPAIIERLKELEQNKKSLTKELETESRNVLNLSKEMIIFFFEKLISGDADDIESQKNIINMVVDKVIIYSPTDYKIIYTFDRAGGFP